MQNKNSSLGTTTETSKEERESAHCEKRRENITLVFYIRTDKNVHETRNEKDPLDSKRYMCGNFFAQHVSEGISIFTECTQDPPACFVNVEEVSS